jgi:hypothetical protein
VQISAQSITGNESYEILCFAGQNHELRFISPVEDTRLQGLVTCAACIQKAHGLMGAWEIAKSQTELDHGRKVGS